MLKILQISTLAALVCQAYPLRNLQEVREISLKEFYTESLDGVVSSDEWAYFKLDLAKLSGEDLQYDEESTDLVVQVQEIGNKFGDPNLYISYTDQVPTLWQFGVRCSFYGEDFCVINGKELKNKQTVTIGVYCNQECKFKIQAELTKELFFNPGAAHKLFFQANSERIIRFQIPDDPEIHNVEIKAINQNKFDKFKVLMVKGNQLPTSENSLYLRAAWENGYVGKFSDDCSCFCRGCNYTVLVSTEKAGYITIGAKVSGQVVDLTSSNGEVLDSVLYNHQQCYSYMVTKEDKDLKIRLESYSGDPNIYVHPTSIPLNLGMSAFNSRDHFENEELILTPKEREAVNATKGLYYVCIFGNTAATYKLTVKNEAHDVFLRSGMSESGYVLTNETINFYYRDPVLNEADVDIKFQLHVMFGQARLRAKLCEVGFNDTFQDFKDNCKYTMDELLEEDPAEKIENHIGSESEKTDPAKCKLPPAGRTDGQVSCVYVVGVIGLAPSQSHFSASVKIEKKAEYTILKEGVPVAEEIKETEPKYFLVSINDPQVHKLTFQVTTIHGDPDLFISRTHKEPSQFNFEKRSIRCGIYPEIVEYQKIEGDPTMKTLEGDYYIAVFGYVQSTFSLVYYVETTDGYVSKVKLMTGQKQKGVLKTTQDSLLYYFRLSNNVKEDVEVRLHSENGHFDLYLGQEFAPTAANYTLKGDDHSPLVFKQNDSTHDIISYYLRVVPKQYAVTQDNQTRDSAGMAYVFSLAFYEQGSFTHLVEGTPIRGQVTNVTIDYYFFDLMDQDISHELVLTPISGNPDLVISFSNKFPDRDQNDFISESKIATDSVLIDNDLLKKFAKNGRRPSTIYIGVYTDDSTANSTYSILATKKHDFIPIQLNNGQMQGGQLEVNETKYYFFKSSNAMPIYATLVPKAGNPDLSVSIITNMSQSKYEWEQYADKPMFVSKESFNTDVIYLNPADQKFKEACGSSCILLFKVDNANSHVKSHFSLSVTRDIMELVENHQIQDEVEEQNKYKYYKFYKSCDDCDLEISITPQQVYHNVMVLVDFNSTQKLPSDENSKWKLQVSKQSTLIIHSDDSLFNKTSSKGLYIIALHAHYNSSYLLSIRTSPHLTEVQKLQANVLSMRKVYIGESMDISFKLSEVKYVYYENWSNSSIKFHYIMNNRLVQSAVDMRLTVVQGKKVPQKEADLVNTKWLNTKAQSKDLIQIENTNKDFFCVQCLFVIRLENLLTEKDLSMRLVISQNDHQGQGFISSLVIGRPTTLKLQANEQALFNFQMGDADVDILTINMALYTGKVKLSFVDEGIRREIYPENELGSSVSLVQDSHSQLQANIKGLASRGKYKLVVKAKSDLHATLLVSSDQELRIIPDGMQNTLKFDSTQPVETRYFTYLPPSHKFQLAINAQIDSFKSHFNIYVRKMSSSNATRRVLQGSTEDFKDKLRQSQPVRPPESQHGENESQMVPQFWKQYTNLGQFDYVVRSDTSKGKVDVFEVVPVELNDDEDMLLIRLEVIKGESSEAEFKATFSGSEVQQLVPGQTVRGHVSNYNSTFKIYEVYINKEDLYQNDTTDLYIEITPCNGKVDFYVSDNYLVLFKKDSHAGFLDIVNEENFGRSTSRLRDIKNLDVVYIGVESSNEFFTGLGKELDSYFEITTRILPSSQQDVMQTYFFDRSNKEIEIVNDDKDPNTFYVKWNQIYQIQDSEYRPAKQVTYQMFAGATQDARYSLNSMCAIEHSNPNQLFALYIDDQSMKSRELKLKRFDLKNIHVIGMMARVRDPITGDMVSLAYEPYSFNVRQFGVKIQTYQLVLIVVLGMIMLFFLGFIIYCLRRKNFKLQQRLQHETRYVQQEYDSNATNSQSMSLS